MSAMVISVTISGAAMRVGITYRRAALSREDMDRVVGNLMQQIEQL
jgi:molybdenum-dependent DNA-binding transcriptional regulator ModE